MAQKPLVGQDLPIIKPTGSYSDIPQSVGLLWTSDQADAKTSTWPYTTINKNKRRTIHDPEGFEPTVQASERPQTYAFERATIEFGTQVCMCVCVYIYIDTATHKHI